jgi:glutamate/tyrosine decarboxylase-like PLP-dependent enzyme
MRNLNKSYTYWNPLTKSELNKNIERALKENIDYYDELIMGIPGSHLDENEFGKEANVLNGSTYLQVLINNPNHIGVHTLGKFEPYFKGTHKLERDVINVITEDILDGNAAEIDGYVSSGGTEGNLQAIWIYRNYFKSLKADSENQSAFENTCILCSADTHYSIDKAADVFNVNIKKISVGDKTREINYEDLRTTLKTLKNSGTKNIIFIINMMTTMFGSVDKITKIVPLLKESNLNYKIHVDGAYGGFLYPFTIENPEISFANQEITSFSLDAHKMLQAPYGTGLFLIRKGYFENTKTESASYVVGKDYTLIGSRSGANAISIYKILFNYGPYDWQERMLNLVSRAEWFFEQIQKLNIDAIYFKGSNIVAINHKHITQEIKTKFGLVSDDSKNPKWSKVVVMVHVKRAKLLLLIKELQNNTIG